MNRRLLVAFLLLLLVLEACSQPPEPDAPTGSPVAESPSPSPSLAPTATAAPVPTATAAPVPTATAIPTPTPTPQPTAAPDQGLTVQTTAGPVQGHSDAHNTLAWLGIPFAAPPTGDLRWQAPVDPTPWTELRTASTLGPACPQLESRDEDGDGTSEFHPLGSEDCLYLNLWRPQSEAGRLRPVMLWIHGGGNVQGTASDPLYQGQTLAAKADVLLVTVQYRMNFFGYLQHEALHSGDPKTDSGSFGTLDLLKALEWVQDNAEAFGGDPSRVTVFGESAGGVNTWAMQLSPLARGLFHGAIAQSGCYSSTSLEDARAQAQSLLEGLVVADGLATAETAASYLQQLGTEGIRTYLYGKSTQTLLEHFASSGGFSLSTYKPIRDGVVYPAGGLQDVVDGHYNRVPFILGANAEEQKLFYSSYSSMTELEYSIIMRSLFGDDLNQVEALYPRDAYTPATPYNQAIGILDFTFESVCAEHAAVTIADYQPTWLYHFRYNTLIPPYDYVYGAAHGFELPFVFGDVESDIYTPQDETARILLSDQIIQYWSCFAYTQNPSCASSSAAEVTPPEWLPLGTARESYHRVLLDTPVSTEILPDLNIERMNFWNTYYAIGLPPAGE